MTGMNGRYVRTSLHIHASNSIGWAGIFSLPPIRGKFSFEQSKICPVCSKIDVWLLPPPVECKKSRHDAIRPEQSRGALNLMINNIWILVTIGRVCDFLKPWNQSGAWEKLTRIPFPNNRVKLSGSEPCSTAFNLYLSPCYETVTTRSRCIKPNYT